MGLGVGEWGGIPIPLALGYDLVAEALGTAAVPLGTVTPLTLVSLAFIIGELTKRCWGNRMIRWRRGRQPLRRAMLRPLRAALRQTRGRRRRWKRSRPRSNEWLFASWRRSMA